MTERYLTILPSARRLMASLRDIGYDLPSAIADLVDNAIDAGARMVEIEICADGPDSWIRVSDDGTGMTARKLDEAMRYGAITEYGNDSLGHFGLGLKTASLSQCRRLTVASRASTVGEISVRRWDLDRVESDDRWELERVPVSEAPDHLLEPIHEYGRGTSVLWEVLDRVLPRRRTEGLAARVIRRATADVRWHLAMTFHRFLDGGGDEERTVDLYINGEPVRGWDPFVRDERRTRALPAQTLSYEDLQGQTVQLSVRPFVLPSQHEFSSVESHRRAGGPRRWNRHQGFYVYRRRRLIQAGGWNRLRTLDEHAKLARIAIDLPEGHEDRFAIDIAKMRVSLPTELRPSLRAIASTTVAVAQQRYREHLPAVEQPEAPLRRDPDAISISRDWPIILKTVGDVLREDPRLRDQLLRRLANADPSYSTST